MEYVYILSNSKYQGLLKIGRTKRHPEIRAKVLNGQTGAIGNFKVEWFKEVSDSIYVEKTLHYYFRNYHQEKEFFLMELNIAIEVADFIIKSLHEIDLKVQTDLIKSISDLEELLEALKISLEFTDGQNDLETKELIENLEMQLHSLKGE